MNICQIVFVVGLLLLLPEITLTQEANSYEIEDNKDMGSCTCDLTKSTCDVYCCCDTDCDNDILTSWKEDTELKCLDLQHREIKPLTRCIAEEELKYYNDRIGLKKYTDPASELTCFTYDRTPEEMGKYYDYMDTLTQDEVNIVLPTATENGIFGDWLKGNEQAKGAGSSTYLQKETITSLNVPNNGGFGLCNNKYSPSFMVNQELSCAQPIVTNCDDSFLNPKTFGNSLAGSGRKGSSSSSARNYMREGTITNIKADGTEEVIESYISLNDSDKCKTGHKLIGGEIFLQVSSELILSGGIYSLRVTDADISGKNYQSQQFTIRFGGSSSATLKSGSPGYISGRPLVLSNSALSASSTTKISGFTLTPDGSYECYSTSAASSVAEKLEIGIDFREDIMFQCRVSAANVQTYCASTSPLLSLLSQISAIGAFSDPISSKSADWVNIIDGVSELTPTYTLTGSIGQCTLPQTITFEIVYSQLGYPQNLQNYIVAARRKIVQGSWVAKAIIVTETESETEVEEEVDQTPVTSAAYFYQNVNIIFKEIKPKEIDKNEVKNPSFIPQVPEDFFYPFRMNSEDGGANSLTINLLLLGLLLLFAIL